VHPSHSNLVHEDGAASFCEAGLIILCEDDDCMGVPWVARTWGEKSELRAKDAMDPMYQTGAIGESPGRRDRTGIWQWGCRCR